MSRGDGLAMFPGMAKSVPPRSGRAAHARSILQLWPPILAYLVLAVGQFLAVTAMRRWEAVIPPRDTPARKTAAPDKAAARDKSKIDRQVHQAGPSGPHEFWPR
jgi:hypothetical protein